MHPTEKLNYDGVNSQLQSINKSLAWTPGQNANALGRTWRHLTGGPPKTLGQIQEFIQDNTFHFYHYVPQAKGPVPHLGQGSELRKNLKVLAEEVKRVYPDTPEKAKLLQHIDTIVRISVNDQMSPEEALLNRIEPGLPPGFPPLARDSSGRIPHPDEQLSELRHLICQMLTHNNRHEILTSYAAVTSKMELMKFVMDRFGIDADPFLFTNLNSDTGFGADEYLEAAQRAAQTCFFDFFEPTLARHQLGLTFFTNEKDVADLSLANDYLKELSKDTLLSLKAMPIIPAEAYRFTQVAATGELPPSFYEGPPRLEFLSLSRTATIPETIRNQTTLRTLNILECPNLESLPPEISALPQLERIVCSEKHLPLVRTYLVDSPSLQEIEWTDGAGAVHTWKKADGPPLRDYLKASSSIQRLE